MDNIQLLQKAEEHLNENFIFYSKEFTEAKMKKYYSTDYCLEKLMITKLLLNLLTSYKINIQDLLPKEASNVVSK